MRNHRFTFVCDEIERAKITDLADKLQRSQSDAVRFVIQKAVYELTQRYPRRGDNTESQETRSLNSLPKAVKHDRASEPGSPGTDDHANLKEQNILF